MKILCITDGYDTNWTYYDTDEKKVYYFSAERELNLKRGTLRENEIKVYMNKRFGFNIKDPNCYIFLNYLNGNGVLRTPIPCRTDRDKVYKKVFENVFVVDHNYAHMLSSLWINDNCNLGISLDGKGNWNRTGVIISNLKDFDNINIFDIPEPTNFAAILKRISGNLSWNKIKNTVMDYVKAPYNQLEDIQGIQLTEGFNEDLYNKLEQNAFLNLKDFEEFEVFIDEVLKDVDLFNKKNIDKLNTLYKFYYDKILQIFNKYIPKDTAISFVGDCANNTFINTLLADDGFDLNICSAPDDRGLSLGLMKFADLYFNLGIGQLDLSNLSNSDLKEEELKPSTINFIKDKINDNKAVAVCIGNAEVGPRSLGHRSILLSTDNPNKNNFKKYWWSILPIISSNIDIIPNSLNRYMLRNYYLNAECKQIQIIDSKHCLFNLLESIKDKELINIPFITVDKPIPNYINDIFNTFINNPNIDYLVINNLIYAKSDGKVVPIQGDE